MHVAKVLTTSITGIALAFSMLASTLPANAAVGYHAAYFSESDFLARSPGQTGQFAVGYSNTGDQAWVKGAANQQANLGTAAPVDNTTDFTAGWSNGWLSANRYTAQNAALVAPGQIGFFIYNFTVPAAAAAGEHRFYGREVIDGVTWMEDYGYYQSVTVGTPAITLSSTPTSPSNNTTPVISGTGATASSLVTVSEGTTTLCTVTSSATGTFSCTTSALAAGSHAISATDAAGLTAGTLTYTVDLTKPTVTGASSPFKDSIIVTFSEKMSCGAGTDPTSIDDDVNFTVTNVSTSTNVGISSVTPSADCTSATIVAATTNGTQYRVTVATTVTDAVGNAMGTPNTALFLASYTTGPVIVSASASAPTGGDTSTVTVKWNQPVCGNAGVAPCVPTPGQYTVDGIAPTSVDTGGQATIQLTTAAPLLAGTTHIVSVFNELDMSGNLQNPNPQSATFTVATASGNLTLLSATFNPETRQITATWNQAVANPSTGSYRTGRTDGSTWSQSGTTSTTTPTNVVITLPFYTAGNGANPFGRVGCAATAASCTISLESRFEQDTFGNLQNPGIQLVNFTVTQDTTAPAVASATINGTAGTVTFSEKVKQAGCEATTCGITIKDSTNTTVASTVTGSTNLITETDTVIDDKVLDLAIAFALPAGTYTVVVSAGNAQDLSFQANPSTAGTVTAGSSDTTRPTVLISTTVAPSSVFTFAYNEAMKTGAVAGSVSTISNYSLDGTALTAATGFASCSGTTTCVVTLSTVPAAGAHIIRVGGVQDLAGNLINPDPTTFGFTN